MAQRARETENFPPKICRIIYINFYLKKILSFSKNTLSIYFLKKCFVTNIWGENVRTGDCCRIEEGGERERAVSKKALSSSSHGNGGGGGGKSKVKGLSLLRIFVIRRTCFSPLPKKGKRKKSLGNRKDRRFQTCFFPMQKEVSILLQYYAEECETGEGRLIEKKPV